MACYHPLKALDFGINPETGKRIIKVVSSDYDPFKEGVEGVKVIAIPCGHCIGCRLKYSHDWAIRCMLELKYHKKACFITLTYNDEHIPLPTEIIDSDGVITTSSLHPLVKRDLQLFFKRLRKAFPEVKIRYYACGEYGSNSMRPHYHAILYGVDFTEDRKYFKTTSAGFPTYVSEKLDSLWNKGFTMVCDVSFETCAYVARYVNKKKYGKESVFYNDNGITPEFSVMSRRPGIARQYYEDNKDKIYEFYKIYDIPSKQVRPP